METSTKKRYGNKEQTNSDQRGGERGVSEERRGRVKSKNMYKGPMDKDNRLGVGLNVGGEGWVGRGD